MVKDIWDDFLLTKREIEIIYFALSRELDKRDTTEEEIIEIENLREKFKSS